MFHPCCLKFGELHVHIFTLLLDIPCNSHFLVRRIKALLLLGQCEKYKKWQSFLVNLFTEFVLHVHARIMD